MMWLRVYVCVGLKVEQVDVLWNCLACDSECCDDFFTWLLNQARNKDQHALSRESLQHIFLKKVRLLLQLPQLCSENS